MRDEMFQPRTVVTSAMHPSRQPARTGKKESAADNSSKMEQWVARKDGFKKKQVLSLNIEQLPALHKEDFYLSSSPTVPSLLPVSQSSGVPEEASLICREKQKQRIPRRHSVFARRTFGDTSPRSWYQKSIIFPKELPYWTQDLMHPLCSQATSKLQAKTLTLLINIKMM